MIPEKIGDIGLGGAGLSPGHKSDGYSSLQDLWLAVRTELDQLYAKMNGSGSLSETNWGADDGVISTTPHEQQFVV